MADTQIAFNCRASADQVAELAAKRIMAAAARAIYDRGRFQFVLAGGRTPLAAYTLLADRDADWDRWHIFFSDERCVATNDPERNSRAAAKLLLERVPIPIENWHPIPAELGAEEAARRYGQLIETRVPFDLVLLGVGEDGHTASLFPGRAVAADAWAMPVHEAPKPPSDRVSLTPRALCATHGMLILATGLGKREALRAWRQGADLPIASVAMCAPTEILMDRAAAGDA